MVDIEFLVQYLVLLESRVYPQLLQWTDNVRLLQTLIEGGVMDDALYQVIRGIRRKIEPEPGKPRFLVTWRGRPEGGYQLFPEGRPG